jgi:hypothetical protein
METIKNKIDIVVYEYKAETADNGKFCRFDRLCRKLASENICLRRYSFEDDREQLKQNKDLWLLICCAGIDMLPATYVNGKIEKIEEYPTKKEIYSWLSGT